MAVKYAIIASGIGVAHWYFNPSDLTEQAGTYFLGILGGRILYKIGEEAKNAFFREKHLLARPLFLTSQQDHIANVKLACAKLRENVWYAKFQEVRSEDDVATENFFIGFLQGREHLGIALQIIQILHENSSISSSDLAHRITWPLAYQSRILFFISKFLNKNPPQNQQEMLPTPTLISRHFNGAENSTSYLKYFNLFCNEEGLSQKQPILGMVVAKETDKSATLFFGFQIDSTACLFRFCDPYSYYRGGLFEYTDPLSFFSGIRRQIETHMSEAKNCEKVYFDVVKQTTKRRSNGNDSHGL